MIKMPPLWRTKTLGRWQLEPFERFPLITQDLWTIRATGVFGFGRIHRIMLFDAEAGLKIDWGKTIVHIQDDLYIYQGRY